MADRGEGGRDAQTANTIGDHKVTEAEYQQFEELAGEQTISTWLRLLILKAIERAPESVTLLAEVLAFRQIVLNLQFAIASGQRISADDIQQLIDAADLERFEMAERALKDSRVEATSTRRTR